MHTVPSPGQLLWRSDDRLLSNSFKAIVTGGWANESDGNVEAPTGHFALVVINENDLPSFTDLFEQPEFDGLDVPVFGNYVFLEDSDGNGHLYKFLTAFWADKFFRDLEREFSQWLDEPVFFKSEDGV